MSAGVHSSGSRWSRRPLGVLCQVIQVGDKERSDLVDSHNREWPGVPDCAVAVSVNQALLCPHDYGTNAAPGKARTGTRPADLSSMFASRRGVPRPERRSTRCRPGTLLGVGNPSPTADVGRPLRPDSRAAPHLSSARREGSEKRGRRYSAFRDVSGKRGRSVTDAMTLCDSIIA